LHLEPNWRILRASNKGAAMANLGKAVQRVVVLRREGDEIRSTVVYRKSTKGKQKVSRLLRPLERLVRKTAKTQERAANSYLQRHIRSNTKKRNGWLKDLPVNTTNVLHKHVLKPIASPKSWRVTLLG
jgi:hypothetical protein